VGRIIRLPNDLCNQIAAGEVVERPASVVKELVENAIDAEATRIEVDVGTGGIGVVRVTDDGVGMDVRDAALAVERHATSKIAHVDDLLALRTFGFRGEALPSIASVSRFVLRTRQRDAQEGAEVACEGGGELSVRPCGMASGTIVEVRDLFFNVPARRKFLKSVGAESAAVTSAVEGLALSAPSLTFVLRRDGRKARQWLRSGDREQRARESKPDDDLRPVVGVRGPLRVEAYLSAPERARAGAAGLTILINGRVVRDRVLSRIVAQAYGSVLESGRYPVGVVYLDIDPARVDVNVHPQKAEVRFAETRAVHDAVFHTVTEGLAGAFGLAPASRAFLQPPQRPTVSGSAAAVGPASGWTAALPAPPVEARDMPPWERHDAPKALAPSERSVEHGADPWGLSPLVVVETATQLPLGVSPGVPTSRRTNPTGGEICFGALRFVAQLRSMFLLCESDDGVVIIDQHAAAERVTFARYSAAYRERTVASQRLLIPVTMSIDAEDAVLIEEGSEAIEATGIDVRVMGPTTAVVTGIPQLLARGDPERLTRDLLDEARRVGGRGFSGAIDLALATMACHGSLRSGEAVSREEAGALLRALDDVDFGGHCPHGRPLLMRIAYEDLERQVGRR
jgi:DNA mismatch repair protein MutL